MVTLGSLDFLNEELWSIAFKSSHDPQTLLETLLITTCIIDATINLLLIGIIFVLQKNTQQLNNNVSVKSRLIQE